MFGAFLMMHSITRFNIRVYGILFNAKGAVLVADEIIRGKKFTKFPGGGLELGEGTIDCLVREFNEETSAKIKVEKHLYTCDFFMPSAFDDDSQVISIYYLVNCENPELIQTTEQAFDEKMMGNCKPFHEAFRWVEKEKLRCEKHLSLPIDVRVVELITAQDF